MWLVASLSSQSHDCLSCGVTLGHPCPVAMSLSPLITVSPFLAIKLTDRLLYFTGEPKERAQLSMGQASEFSLSVQEYDINTLTADITSPSGKSEPCILKKLPNGHLGML